MNNNEVTVPSSLCCSSERSFRQSFPLFFPFLYWYGKIQNLFFLKSNTVIRHILSFKKHSNILLYPADSCSNSRPTSYIRAEVHCYVIKFNAVRWKIWMYEKTRELLKYIVLLCSWQAMSFMCSNFGFEQGMFDRLQ